MLPKNSYVQTLRAVVLNPWVVILLGGRKTLSQELHSRFPVYQIFRL